MDSRVCDRLAEVRRTFGLTQRQLAKNISCTSQLISMVESGKSPLSLRTAKAIEYVYSVSANWLLFGDGEMMVRPGKADSVTFQILKSFPDLHKAMNMFFSNLGLDDLDALNRICAKACRTDGIEDKAS